MFLAVDGAQPLLGKNAGFDEMMLVLFPLSVQKVAVVTAFQTQVVADLDWDGLVERGESWFQWGANITEALLSSFTVRRSHVNRYLISAQLLPSLLIIIFIILLFITTNFELLLLSQALLFEGENLLDFGHEFDYDL